MSVVNTYAPSPADGGSWTPIVACGNHSATCVECIAEGITEIEFVRLVLDRHSLEMGQLVGTRLLWAS
jgi:hypothetical protein